MGIKQKQQKVNQIYFKILEGWLRYLSTKLCRMRFMNFTVSLPLDKIKCCAEEF